MCLETLDKKRKIAGHDIVCYKIVERVEPDGIWRTPFRLCRIPDAVISGRRFMVGRGLGFVRRKRDNSRIVGRGYVHVYRDEDVKFGFLMDETYSSFDGITVSWHLFKCVIPVGTAYWESLDGETFCAKRIKFVSQIF